MLEDNYKSYRALADDIKWKKYDKNELFFECIKHEHDSLYDNFYSALVCRFWGYAAKIYVKNKRHIPYDQCYDILIDTLNYVLTKRVWEDPKSSLYNDPAAPDKAFHIVLKRQQGIVLANLNAQKRRSNFNALSIDEIHEEYADAAEGLFGIDDASESTSENNIKLITFIKEHSIEHIIVLDAICFSHWKTLNQVVSKIKAIEYSDYNYYKQVYNIKERDYNNIIMAIHNKSNKKLLSDIKKLLYAMRDEV